MLVEYTRGTVRDFRQRYEGVYGFYPKSNGEEVLVYVSSVGEQVMKFKDSKGASYTAYADHGVTFKFIPLNRKLFVYNKELILANRVPSRQWQRGICQGNTRMRYVSMMYSDLPISFSTVEAYLAADKELYKEFSTKLLTYSSGVLSPLIGWTCGDLYVTNQKVGNIRTDHVEVTNEFFIQEIRDCFRDLEIQVPIKGV